MQGKQRVGGHERALQVWQRERAAVIAFSESLVIGEQRKQDTKPGDLNGDGINVHAMDAILDQVEFPGVISLAARKRLRDRALRRFAIGAG